MTTTTNTAAGTARVNDTDAIMNALATMMPSPLPALVFTSLAAVSVPTFSDRCHILVDEDGLRAYRIERPLTATADLGGNPGSHQHRVRDAWSGQWVGDHMVQTSFDQTATGRIIGYRVSVLHLWNGDYHPTGTDVALAQLAVDHAVACLHREPDQPRARTFPGSGRMTMTTVRPGPASSRPGASPRLSPPPRAETPDIRGPRVVDYAGQTTTPTAARLLMAWARPDVDRRERLTHAVLSGQHIAACGANLAVIGDHWPAPPAPTPQPRCPICTQTVHGEWAGLDYTTPSR